MRAALVAVLLFTFAALTRRAEAACVSRPTDEGGYEGYGYGSAEAKAYSTAQVTVHWAASGTHAPALASSRADGVPDTVAYAADIAEDALGRYAAMGYKKPPPDGACPSHGDDDKLDIYLVRFTAGDGITVPTCAAGSCASFVLVDATYKNRGYADAQEGFRTVVSHELFHAVQNTYAQHLDPFWSEGTAQWAMKTLHPELQDFERQLPGYFAEPQRSFDAPPNGVATPFLYGSAVWPLFLVQRHTPDVVREVFEALAAKQGPALGAIDTVLVRKGSSLAAEYPIYAAWNAATGALAGTGGYPDAAKYPGEKVADLTDGATAITSGLGSYAYRGALVNQTVSLDTDAARNVGTLVPIVNGAPDLAHPSPLPAGANGDVLVVVSGITTKKSDAPFTIHVVQTAPAAAAKSSDDGGCSTSGRSPSSFGILVVLCMLLRRRR